MELNKDYTKVDLTKLQPGDAGLRQLSYLLRHPEKWLKDHTWNFYDVLENTKCGTSGCAIGVAMLQWGRIAVNHEWYGSWSGANDIFNGGWVYGCRSSEITSVMVADAIDHYLIIGQVGDDR